LIYQKEKRIQEQLVHSQKMESLGLLSGRIAHEFNNILTGIIGFAGLLHAKILWSPHAHARIKNIDITKALKVRGVKAILTYKDVPRIPHTTAGQGYPEPSPYDTYILDSKVRYVGDRVAAVACESLESAEEAIKAIKVEY